MIGLFKELKHLIAHMRAQTTTAAWQKTLAK